MVGIQGIGGVPEPKPDRSTSTRDNKEAAGASTATSKDGVAIISEAQAAAHRKLPFGSVVRVTNMRNGKAVKVRINDRGPFVRGRVIDVSRGAAKKIGMLKSGVVPVRLKVIRRGPG
jgi:rare lipoprotein A